MKWTTTSAAKEFGVSRNAILRALQDKGHDTGKMTEFTTQQIYEALAGDFRAQRTRETRERANLLEMERRKKEGEIIFLSDAEQLLREVLGVVQIELRAFPAKYAALGNPNDPALNRATLETGVQELNKSCQEKAIEIAIAKIRG